MSLRICSFFVQHLKFSNVSAICLTFSENSWISENSWMSLVFLLTFGFRWRLITFPQPVFGDPYHTFGIWPSKTQKCFLTFKITCSNVPTNLLTVFVPNLKFSNVSPIWLTFSEHVWMSLVFCLLLASLGVCLTLVSYENDECMQRFAYF